MMAGPADQYLPTLAGLLDGIIELDAGLASVGITGLSQDSRDLQPGELFLACPGYRQHGMAFADQAVAVGCAAILAGPSEEWPQARIQAAADDLPVPVITVAHLERWVGTIAAGYFGDPSRSLGVTGITGTNGKTSCAHFLAQALQGQGRCALIGTLGNGFLDDLKPATHTTPDAVQLQRLVADFSLAGATDIAMEVSSHALHQYRVAGVGFDEAVFTNLSRDHLDYHETMEAYGEAKARLFTVDGLRAAVINTDDPFGRSLIENLDGGIESVAYGMSHEIPAAVSRWVRGRNLSLIAGGIRMEIDSSWGSGRLQSPVIGRFNAMNLLAVLGVLLVRGIPLADALERLAGLSGVPGRMERIAAENGPVVLVDYAHTPDALEQLLTAAREHCAGRLICVFGCGGDRDRGKRPQMGEVAERLADALVLTDDNPRHEDGEAIVSDILLGMRHPDAARVVRNRAQAIAESIAKAASDDWIVVAGKGHETVQIIGDLSVPFSDRDVVERALAGMDR